jgi:hypothetical protein
VERRVNGDRKEKVAVHPIVMQQVQLLYIHIEHIYVYEIKISTTSYSHNKEAYYTSYHITFYESVTLVAKGNFIVIK